MSQLVSHLSFSLPLAVSPELQRRICWTWDLPLWTSVLLTVLAVAWITTIYFRENSPAGKPLRLLLTLLRTTAVALAVVMFAQPVEEWFRLGKPRLVVLVDRSTSMSTADVDNKPRLVAEKTALAEGEEALLAKWQDSYQLDVVTFAEDVAPIVSDQESVLAKLKSVETSDDPQAGTRLGDALLYALRELPGSLPTAIVVFTDGVSTHGRPLREVAEQARGLRVPLYAVAIGSEQRRPDVAVEDLLVEEVVFPGDRLQVEATLRAIGYAGRAAQSNRYRRIRRRLPANELSSPPRDHAPANS